MTLETIIRDAEQDGVSLALTPDGKIRIHGNKAAVEKWTPAIQDKKLEILTVLQSATEPDSCALPDADMEKRRRYVLRMLRDNPQITRAWVADGDQDPVRVHLAVRGVGSCELTIQADRWDPLQFAALMDRQAGTA